MHLYCMYYIVLCATFKSNNCPLFGNIYKFSTIKPVLQIVAGVKGVANFLVRLSNARRPEPFCKSKYVYEC